MVGADSVDKTESETVPERMLIAFFAKRWRHHVLHAFDARPFGEGFIQKEMRKDGLDAQVDTALFGGEGGVEGFLAREVDDVAGGAGVFKESGETVGAFGLDGFRAAGLVPLRTRFAFSEELLLKAGDKFGVFAMGRDNDAETPGEGQGLVHFAVVDAKEIFVSEEDFEGGSAVGNDFAKLGFGFGDELGDGHVEGVVTGALAGGFGLPKVITGQSLVIAIGTAHFDVCGGAADERGDAGGFVGVLGEGGHEGEIDVDVGIDEAREDEFSGSVDNFSAGRNIQVFADAGDGFVFSVDIGVNAGTDGDDFAISDQQAHRTLLKRE